MDGGPKSDVGQARPFPAIAGVRLRGSGNSGHFITVLDRKGAEWVVGDPLEGRIIESQSQLLSSYEFTGFFMVAK